MPLSNQKKEALKKEFISKEFKVWSSKHSEFSRLPDNIKQQTADYWLTIIDSLIDEKVKEIEKIDEYIEAYDQDGARYQIPRSKQQEWSDFCDIPYEDEESWNTPEWAERIDGLAVTSFKEQCIKILKE